MTRSSTSVTILRLKSRRVVEIVIAAIIAVVLSLVISNLPKFELLEAAINDDNFTDLVIQTRGELPIDTSIRVVTYDASILDTFDMVDRATLAMRLASLMELKPRVVGVDFLIETERPEAPEGDEMLAGLIADHPNLIFGIFHEDSLKRFRTPPRRFNLRESQLGCINLAEDDDRTIRTFTTVWGAEGSKQYESFDLKVVRAFNTAAVARLASHEEETYVIDYAAGIGETKREGSAGEQIFPVMPLRTIFETVASGDSAGTAALRGMFQGKLVLVGYGDLRNGQVTSVVDRFYTPFKPEKNTLPDMHGVAIHANIVNTLLKGRAVQVVAPWMNVLWGAVMVMLLLIGREYVQSVTSPAKRTALTYTGFGFLFFLAALLPVLAYRYTSFKFSIYTPIAGLLLAVPTLEALDKGVDLIRDLRRRMRLRSPLPPSMRAGLRDILGAWSSDERMERAIHFLQLQFHTACAVLFHEAASEGMLRFEPGALAAPSLQRMLAQIDGDDRDGDDSDTDTAISQRARQSAALLRVMAAEPLLARTLRLSRSLYIALNEIRRQSIEGMITSDTDATAQERSELEKSVAGYADLALKALTEKGRLEAREEFDELYASLERFAMRAADILRGDAAIANPIGDEERIEPYIFPCRCRVHNVDERFVYFGEQEDTNSRDDFFDLVYIGRTIRCQPVEHLGLQRFREMTRPARENDRRASKRYV